MMTIAAFVAAVYLLNPSFGVFEFVPDNLPLVGNLDEAMMAVVVVGVLGHFGIDVADVFWRSPAARARMKDTVTPSERDERF